ncbi:hypothetical protein Q5H93_04515 [Hymenobacter sp. ASUV-10]|uniref:Uncharacterized protein n=1 Tax=Hymenobacter aranciens TaxID=3063996 RepID=A0ABT9BAC2_9BACT|nr:hypothetical protein [Hymenobacter sp. ASUV-10]MDO7873987.1 hypothetical protein [Hymenobacter sp. ASUV-10]
MKRIDFPVKPHILKYLLVHLKLQRIEGQELVVDDFVLSTTNRFGFALNALLRKPAKSARHEASIEDCTGLLGVNLRNFNGAHYELMQGNLSAYSVFQFNDFVDDNFRAELFWWVKKAVALRSTIKDAIYSFMAFYDIREEDIAFETLRKDVQRNADLAPRKKNQPKGKNFSVNLSRKTGDLSRKTGDLSRKTGVLSHKDTFIAVREQLMKLPLPLFETQFFYAGA